MKTTATTATSNTAMTTAKMMTAGFMQMLLCD